MGKRLRGGQLSLVWVETGLTGGAGRDRLFWLQAPPVPFHLTIYYFTDMEKIIQFTSTATKFARIFLPPAAVIPRVSRHHAGIRARPCHRDEARLPACHWAQPARAEAYSIHSRTCPKIITTVK